MPTDDASLLLAFKKLYWELSHAAGRFEYVQYFLGNLPGDFGMLLRRRFYRRRFKACGSALLVAQGARFRNIQCMTLGNRVQLGVDSFYQAAGGITIHDDTMIGPGVKIWSANHRFDSAETAITDQGYDLDPVTIGPNVWLASNVFIMPGVELPEGCVVSAGSVVGKKQYPPFSVIAGNPARVIGSRRPE